MTDERLKELKNGGLTENELLQFIPNNLGINLVAVDDIKVVRQEDGQLVSFHVDFIPECKQFVKVVVSLNKNFEIL